MAPPTSTLDLTAAPLSDLLTKQTALPTASDSPAVPLTTQRPLDASLLTTTYTTSPKPYSPPTSWGGQDVTTDHWITATWSVNSGWAAPQLRPYTRTDLWPTASCLHYATECFEGLKAYRGVDGKVRLFRPNRNTARMLISSTRIACPAFPPDQLESLITTLLATDGPKWLPDNDSFIYIRPTMIGTGRALGVQQPREAMLFIVMTLFPRLDKPMKLLASAEDSIRAWPGGFGFAKVGANYGPSLLAQKGAQMKGFDQILWLFGKEGWVTEAGASNFFVLLLEDGVKKLVTAPLDDKIILDGVTRRSLLELARERLPGVEVVERRYTMAELVKAHEEGRLLEAFAAGTAFFVAQVKEISFKDTTILLPLAEGSVTLTLKASLKAIMYGEVDHEWGVVVPEVGFKEEFVDEEEIREMMEKLRELKKSKAWMAAEERVKAEELGEAL